jgi:hypothetical protein
MHGQQNIKFGNLLFSKTVSCLEVCLCYKVNELYISKNAGFNLDYSFTLLLIRFSIRALRIATCER